MATSLKKRWTPIEIEEVVKQFKETKSVEQVAIKFNKTPNAIIYVLSKSLKDDKEKKILTDAQLLEKYGVSPDELIVLMTPNLIKKSTLSLIEINNGLRLINEHIRLENEYITLSMDNKKLRAEATSKHVDISELLNYQIQQNNKIIDNKNNKISDNNPVKI